MYTDCDYNYLFKLIIIGDSSVGKSCLLTRYVDKTFNSSSISTIGVDFKIKTIEHNNKIIKLQLWDTAGQERFKSIVSSYYRGSHGVIIVFDITNKESFENVEKWISEYNMYCQRNIQHIKILIGNKSDDELCRKVPYKDAHSLALKHKIPYIETSAKTNANVEIAFTLIVDSLINYMNQSEIKNKQKVNLKNAQSINMSSFGSCC